jgi:uncharacterized protein (TIGR03663 family)
LFYTRYFIHEIYFVLFTLGIYLNSIYFRDLKHPFFLYGLFACASMLYATKETSIIIFIVMGLSVITTEFGAYALHRFKAHSPFTDAKKRFIFFLRRFWLHIIIGTTIAFIIWALLYSSFFTNSKGLADSFRTYATWTKTGIESGHEKRFMYFLADILLPYETPLLLLSIVGAIMAFISRKKSGLYLFSWMMGIFLAQSIIPYKTPWLVLNLLLPMALLGGFGVQEMVYRLFARRHLSIVAPSFVLLILISSVLLIRQFPLTVWMAYVDFDNEEYPQIYVHTSRDVYRLLNEIESIGKRSGSGKNITINIVSPHEWPLPFYLRNYPNANFWRKYENIPALESDLLISEENQHEGLFKLLGKAYTTKSFVLRKGIPLELWVKKKLSGE